MKRLLLQHEKRLNELKSSKTSQNESYSGSTTKNYTSASGWKDMNNWRKIKHGMNQTTVIRILGQPTSIERGAITTLHYKKFT